jgi:1-acyl-sn-glycerol-3-phosphate acyltransferase
VDTGAGLSAAAPARPDFAQRPSRAQLAFYSFARAVVLAVCRAYWRLEVFGNQNVPPSGPYVVAPVHRSNIDILVVAGITKRRLRYMGKDPLFKHAFWRWLFHSLGGFPVHRGTIDREALRRSLQVLAAGEPLVIYPEGTRLAGPTVGPIFDGAAYVATKAQVPLLPVGIAGSEVALGVRKHLPKPTKVCVVVGKPLQPPPRQASRAEIRALTEELARAMQAAQDEAELLRAQRRPRLFRRTELSG